MKKIMQKNEVLVLINEKKSLILHNLFLYRREQKFVMFL